MSDNASYTTLTEVEVGGCNVGTAGTANSSSRRFVVREACDASSERPAIERGAAGVTRHAAVIGFGQ